MLTELTVAKEYKTHALYTLCSFYRQKVLRGLMGNEKMYQFQPLCAMYTVSPLRMLCVVCKIMARGRKSRVGAWGGENAERVDVVEEVDRVDKIHKTE